MVPLEKIISLYKSIKGARWQGGYVFGQVPVDSFLLGVADEFGEDLELEFQDSTGAVLLDGGVEDQKFAYIKFLPPRKKYCFFAKDMADYLSYFDFKINACSDFYISNVDGRCLSGETEDSTISAYLKLLDLYLFIRNLADHVDTESRRCVFVSALGKNDIYIDYDHSLVERLAKESVPLAGEECEEILSAPHKSTKISLFSKSIFQYVAGVSEKERFAILVFGFSEIIKDYYNNYELFLNDFSFENEREKLEESKREYLLKLNSILDGIHSKLLAIPVSLVIVAGQMKGADVEGYFLINLIIICGAFVFTSLMLMMTANQLHSLKAVKTDYDEKKRRLRIELRGSLYKELKVAFLQLDKRFKHQRNMIRFVDYVVVAGFLLSLFVFEYQTKLFVSL